MACVTVDRRDGIALVTMNRPPANALDPTSLADGLAVLDELTSEPPPAVVITGSGAFFSGGADLRVVPALDPEAQAEMARGINALFAGWYQFPRPVVTAVNGHTVAGGLVLALCGDHRIGPTTGRFGLTEVKAGIPFPSAAMAVVQAELSGAAARRMVLRAELFDAAAALGLGVFDECVPDGDVVERALAVAAELAALPPTTYAAVKARLRAGVIERSRGQFGGAAAAAWISSEATGAAARILD